MKSFVILFTSSVHAPFVPKEVRQRTTPTHLWGVASDGRRSERLSTEGNVLYLRPTDNAVAIDLLVTQPISLETNLVHQHVLGSECSNTEFPCDHYEFSPDGAWAAYFWGKEVCGRGIAVLDLRTDETRILAEEGGHSFTFVAEETMLIATGHCEGGTLAVVNLSTGEQHTLGQSGSIRWNASQTAFAVNAHPYMSWGSAVWGYNVIQAQHFISPTAEHDAETLQPLWTPTGEYLLYQQRAISYTTSTRAALTLGPQQIIIVDAATGKRQITLSDPAYEICPWEGDLIEVRRIPYQQHIFDLENP